jgi:putative ABC transport system substrate-binding protein
MRRREFLGALGSAAASWPLAARAQQAERVRRIGVLMGFAEEDEVWQAYLASFRSSLKDLGWIEGRNVRFDYRFAGDNPERTRAAAVELVALAPDLIFVSTNPVLVSDSVGSGYVASLARPGGNVTGFHNFEPAFGGKWLEILKEIAPGVQRVAVLHVPDISANLALLRATETASKTLGLTIVPTAARNADDVERVLTAFAQEPGGGLIVTPGPLTGTRRDVIIGMAGKLGLPAIYSFGFYSASGGLVSYGLDQLELVRGAASYVDRILRGANVGELPVQLPTKYPLVINLKTAKALGLKIPESFLLRADEVIE